MPIRVPTRIAGDRVLATNTRQVNQRLNTVVLSTRELQDEVCASRNEAGSIPVDSQQVQGLIHRTRSQMNRWQMTSLLDFMLLDDSPYVSTLGRVNGVGRRLYKLLDA